MDTKIMIIIHGQVASWRIERTQSSLIIHPDEPYPCDGLDRSVKATVAANNDGVRNLTLRHFGALEKTRVFVAHQ